MDEKAKRFAAAEERLEQLRVNRRKLSERLKELGLKKDEAVSDFQDCLILARITDREIDQLEQGQLLLDEVDDGTGH